MKRSTQLLKITSIIYDNTDNNVLIQAINLKDHLSFETQMFVNFSELNIILSELQKRNPTATVSELFVEEHLGDQFYQYYLDANCLANPTIIFDSNLLKAEKKQIRA